MEIVFFTFRVENCDKKHFFHIVLEGYAAFTRESLARTVNGIPDEFKI